MSFASELKAEAAAMIAANEEVVKVAAITLFNNAITWSPVGNPDLWVWFHPQQQVYVDYVAYRGYPEGYTGGAFRANWYLTFNSPSTSFDETNLDHKAQLNQVGAIATADYKGRYILTNNAPYAQRLEDGWSTQAAPGKLVASNMSTVEASIPKLRAAAYKKYGVKA